ncbi:hypothetical protein [Polyangium aurulentum]|uniref:hypothetical protein n=1 Tax=Polyangium aurulentum TaxID=2567896 RepID=UPI0010AE0CF9|nr:hypothetical protein [Polyangium aurulentum]UQA58310.1 hypothetical protein E8A73_044880 [Polyangium aurulentum]
MFGSDDERDLARVFEPGAMPHPGHKQALEAELADRFDALYAARRRKAMERRKVKQRVFFGVGIAAALGLAACAAPMDVDVEVGRSLAIEYPAGAAMLEPRAVVDALHGAGKFEDVQVRVLRQNENVAIKAEVWGQDIGDEPLGDRMKRALPALAGAKIVEEPLEGKVKSTLGRKLGHDLLDLDIADGQDVEKVRAQILERLAAQGVEGKIDVEVEGDGIHERRVRIRVEDEECEPGEPPKAP